MDNDAITALTWGFLLPATAFAMGVAYTGRSGPQVKTRLLTAQPLEDVPPSEAFTPDELSTITQAYNNNDDEEPEGKILRDRHGFTHYVFDSSSSSSSGDKKGIVVLVHGLGTSLKMYKELADKFVKEGYSVLRYEFYGHGYSKYGEEDMFVQYSPDMLADQLEDLLEHVCRETKEEVLGIVGHSAGGVAAIACAERWGNEGAKRGVIPKVCLACPVVYSKKPFMARVADKIPGFLTSVMRNVKSLQFIIGDSYMEAGEIAFGRDPETGKVIYKEKDDEVRKGQLRLFGRVEGVKKHPFLEAGILGLNCNTFREDLQPAQREKLLTVLERSGDAKCDVLWVWGELDMTVPYKENVSEVEGWATKYDNLRLQTLERIGHDMFYENSGLVFEEILPFFKN